MKNTHYLCGLETVPVLDDNLQTELEKLARSTRKVSKISLSERLKEAGGNDPRLKAIIDAGLYERDIGGGKHSICCPFEHLHSDVGRSGGDGDTIYYQPHTNGYREGWIHCLHTHGNDQGKYWKAIGYSVHAEAFKELMFENLDAQGWAIPHPLPDDLPPVPQFDLSLLPGRYVHGLRTLPSGCRSAPISRLSEPLQLCPQQLEGACRSCPRHTTIGQWCQTSGA